MNSKNHKYEIALSFAGEDRAYVEQIAKCLKSRGITIFYDKYEQANLWGKDLIEHLDDIYTNQATYCVMFLSKHYANKLWTNHERKSAQAKAFLESKEYILPVRLDDTEIPGLRATVGFIDGRAYSPEEICELISKKLGKSDTEVKTTVDDFIYTPRINKTFTDLEKQKFVRESFQEIENYFIKALEKLKSSYSSVETDLDKDNKYKFIVSIFIYGKLKVQCKIWIGGMGNDNDSISYLESTRGLASDSGNTLNDSARISDDGEMLYFNILGSVFGSVPGIEKMDLKRASAKDVAKYYWGRFVRYLQF